jgi:hypothetical protein
MYLTHFDLEQMVFTKGRMLVFTQVAIMLSMVVCVAHWWSCNSAIVRAAYVTVTRPPSYAENIIAATTTSTSATTSTATLKTCIDKSLQFVTFLLQPHFIASTGANLMTISFMYLCLPYDLFPDQIPLIGKLDDIFFGFLLGCGGTMLIVGEMAKIASSFSYWTGGGG